MQTISVFKVELRQPPKETELKVRSRSTNDIIAACREMSLHVIVFTTFLQEIKLFSDSENVVLRKDEQVFVYEP